MAAEVAPERRDADESALSGQTLLQFQERDVGHVGQCRRDETGVRLGAAR